MKILITGGAGFIGSAVIRQYIRDTEHTVVNVDALTYAGNLSSLEDSSKSRRYFFEHINICDKGALEGVFEKHQPDAVMHLAAESHVDRSIDDPSGFIQTNIIGTFNLLDISKRYWSSLDKKRWFRFLHVSTDEVYGELSDEGLFVEDSAYSPSSPYSASKASSDHLVKAWFKTYGFPCLISNCSNNYGAYQYPEKLIPLMILNAIEGKRLPVYGQGQQVRDWLYVDDHAAALRLILQSGKIGDTYNVGGFNEKTNLQVVKTICQVLDEKFPTASHVPHESLINFVEDRPGHDYRYAIDASKIQSQLGWQATETFESGLSKTIDWYLNNKSWCESITQDGCVGKRLGLGRVEL